MNTRNVAQGWTSTKSGEIIRWKNSNGKCAFCGNIGKTSEIPYRGKDGGIKMYPACDNCKKSFNTGNNSVNAEELGKSDKTDWTKVMRVISIGFAIISTLAGAVILTIVGNIVGDGFGFLGFLGGAVIGFAIGVVSIAFTMVICEISTTLKDILRELRRK